MSGLREVSNEHFDAASAVGGWRGIVESVAPTLVFVLVMALRPSALVAALTASLALSAVGLVARLIQREPLTQVLGGAVLALISAAWAWRSGEAQNFYATGLVINAVWLVACTLSLAAGWPLVGVLMGLWTSAAQQSQDAGDDGEAGSLPSTWAAWRTQESQAGVRRRYTLATVVLAAMFALRLGVEVPLYLAGQDALGALGVARLVAGVPLFALTLWFIWLLVRPARQVQSPQPAEG
ncbi:membrane protein [Actinomyces urogenitalis S6-C4]|nr:membrane protein [Actinomyces urogenitalis S6-C4]KGE99662.1 membrane protein [Actinomyces urogenitalis S6-C4]